MNLTFDVSGQRLTGHAVGPVVSDSVGYLTAGFTFSEDWADLDKWAHLESEKGEVYDVHLTHGSADAKLNLTAGHWQMWLHGNEITNGATTVRATTTTVTFDVSQYGRVDEQPLPVIALSVAEQIAANTAYAIRMIEAMKADAEALKLAADKASASAQAASADSAEAKAAKREAELSALAAKAAKDDAETAKTATLAAEERVASMEAQTENAAQVAETAKTEAESAMNLAVSASNQSSDYARSAEFAARSASSSEAMAIRAQTAIENMGVSAETLPAGSDATVEKQVSSSGAVNLKFGIPAGSGSSSGGASVELDPTLKAADKAAQAKAVGDAIAELADSISEEEQDGAAYFSDTRYPFSTEKTSLENNEDIVADVRLIAKSYYDNRGTSNNPTFNYSQKTTPFDSGYFEGSKGMDCSSFVQLVLGGISYEDSPYTGNELAVKRDWGFLPILSHVRTAAAMGQAFYFSGCAVSGISYGENYNFDNARIGDLVFFAKGNRPNRFKGISHVAVIANIKADGTHTMYECTTGAPYVLNRTLESDYTSSETGKVTQSPKQVVLIARPKYIEPTGEASITAQVAKNTADIAELKNNRVTVSDVLAALPTWEGGSY